MKTLLILLALMIATPVALTACDRTLSEQSKTTENDNGTQTQTKKVVEQPNGTITEEKTKSSTANNQ